MTCVVANKGCICANTSGLQTLENGLHRQTDSGTKGLFKRKKELNYYHTILYLSGGGGLVLDLLVILLFCKPSVYDLKSMNQLLTSALVHVRGPEGKVVTQELHDEGRVPVIVSKCTRPTTTMNSLVRLLR
jgi:hypothetical protein